MSNETDSYIKLRYSSDTITKEYLQLLPTPVLNKLYSKIFYPNAGRIVEPMLDPIYNIIFYVEYQQVVSQKELVATYLKYINQFLLEYHKEN